MTDQHQKGFYAKPGGYELFSKDIESILEEYNNQTTELVKVIYSISGIQRLMHKYINHHRHHHYFVCVYA